VFKYTPGWILFLIVFAAGCGSDAPVRPTSGGPQQGNVAADLQVELHDNLTDLIPEDDALTMSLLSTYDGSVPEGAWVAINGDSAAADTLGVFGYRLEGKHGPGDTLWIRYVHTDADTMKTAVPLPRFVPDGLATVYDLTPGVDSLRISWTANDNVRFLWVSLLEQKTRDVRLNEYVSGDSLSWTFRLPDSWWDTFSFHLEFHMTLDQIGDSLDTAQATYNFSRRLDVYP
jgi:hypothetical protein